MTYSACSRHKKVWKGTYLRLRGVQVSLSSGLMNDITAGVCSCRFLRWRNYELTSREAHMTELCGSLVLGFACCCGTRFRRLVEIHVKREVSLLFRRPWLRLSWHRVHPGDGKTPPAQLQQTDNTFTLPVSTSEFSTKIWSHSQLPVVKRQFLKYESYIKQYLAIVSADNMIHYFYI